MNFQAQQEREVVWQCSECGLIVERSSPGNGVMSVFTCGQCNERQVFERATVQ